MLASVRLILSECHCPEWRRLTAQIATTVPQDPRTRFGGRLAALEATIVEMQRTFDVHFARIAQIQAQIDRMAAKDRSEPN